MYSELQAPCTVVTGCNTPKQGLLSDRARALYSPPQEHQAGLPAGSAQTIFFTLLGGTLCSLDRV